jgi:ribonuclease BN (tRNA processing enzyme)
LTVLGGSAASPNTGAGCSGYLVRSGDTTLLLDPGPGTLPELRRHADFRTLSAVIVSHMHLDHMLDLLALRHALAYNPVSAPAPIPIWLPPGGASLLERAAAPFDESDVPGRFAATVHVTEYDPSQSLAVGPLTLAFAPTVHYLPTWAMRITAPNGRSLGYTGDTGPAAIAGLASFFAGVDLLLAEATLLDAGDSDPTTRGSLTASEAGRLARDARTARLVLTHLWEELGFGRTAAGAAAAFSGAITLARPGLQIEVCRGTPSHLATIPEPG